jgi:hypothetical protein
MWCIIKLFDTAVNQWLIEAGLLDPLNGSIDRAAGGNRMPLSRRS